MQPAGAIENHNLRFCLKSERTLLAATWKSYLFLATVFNFRITYGTEHEAATTNLQPISHYGSIPSGATAAPEAAATNSELVCNSGATPSASATGAAMTNLQLVRNYGSMPSSVIGAAAHSSEGSQFEQAATYITHAPGTYYCYGASSAIYSYPGNTASCDGNNVAAAPSVYAVAAPPACQ